MTAPIILLVFLNSAVLTDVLKCSESSSNLISFFKQFQNLGAAYENDLLPDFELKYILCNNRSSVFTIISCCENQWGAMYRKNLCTYRGAKVPAFPVFPAQVKSKWDLWILFQKHVFVVGVGGVTLTWPGLT